MRADMRAEPVNDDGVVELPAGVAVDLAEEDVLVEDSGDLAGFAISALPGPLVAVALADEVLWEQERRMRLCGVGSALTSDAKTMKKTTSVLKAYIVNTNGGGREVKTGEWSIIIPESKEGHEKSTRAR
jgi:hypothetical protein